MPLTPIRNRLPRVIVSCHPGHGHLNPLVPLARALLDAGCEVEVASSPQFCPAIRAAGLRPLAVGRPWLTARAAESFPVLRSMSLQQQARAIPEHVFAAVAEETADDLTRAARSLRPDLLIRESWELGTALVADALGIPLATVGFAQWVPLARLPRWRGREAVRTAGYGSLYLDLVPPPLQLPARRPALYQAIRPAVVPVASPRPVVGRGRALVYATLGTVFNRVPEVYRAIVSAFRARQGSPGLILSLGGGDSLPLGRSAAHVRIHRRVQQLAVLPHCDAVIHHGGYGSTIETIVCEKPALIIPISGDQAFFAARCQALGVALAMHPSQATPAAIREAIEELLAPDYRRRVRRLAAQIRRLPGPHVAARLLRGLTRPRSAPQWAMGEDFENLCGT